MELIEHGKSPCGLRPASVAQKVNLQSLVIGEGYPRGGNTVTLVIGQNFYASTSLYAAEGERSAGGQLIEWRSGNIVPNGRVGGTQVCEQYG